MMSSRLFLLVLAVCGVVRTQNITSPEKQNTRTKETNPLCELGAKLDKLVQESELRDRARVAFSASLVDVQQWTYLGPFEKPTTLEFKKVTTNVGEAYNPSTGVFTVPMKGVYYIRFTGCVGSSGTLDAGLMKNSDHMFAIYDTRGTHGCGSNGMPMVLEEGDRLSITMWAGSIFDQTKISTFSGFLLYPL